ncbi:uncharacterized protein PSFLO_01438 [Pseudozyma flocculosa]|uniref:Uncharacterized protein n=1 Tax=Pseudozyma flocculosa TaxID=84751 RepID=A0A5C3EX50_9BASI|nr:uncharacterized protein PSFLO_01438 [Pseudozyma flocculosa]
MDAAAFSLARVLVQYNLPAPPPNQVISNLEGISSLQMQDLNFFRASRPQLAPLPLAASPRLAALWMAAEAGAQALSQAARHDFELRHPASQTGQGGVACDAGGVAMIASVGGPDELAPAGAFGRECTPAGTSRPSILWGRETVVNFYRSSAPYVHPRGADNGRPEDSGL